MKLFATLVLIATCFVVATEAQQTTPKPSTSKSITSKITTSKTTTAPSATTTVKTTTTTTTLKSTTTTTLKPTTKTTTTLKPTTTTITTLRPTTTTTTTTSKPTTTTTTTTSKPTTKTTTTLKPTTKTTSKPTTTTTTSKPTTTTTTTTVKPTTTTTTTTSKPTTTTLKPTTTTTTTSKPTTTTTTTTTLKPTITTTTTTTLKPTTTTTTTSKPTTTTTATTTLKPTTTTLKPVTTTTTTSKPTTTTTSKPTTTTTTTTTSKPTATTLKPTTTTTTTSKPTTTTTTTTTSKPTTTTTTTTTLMPTTTTTTTSKPTTTTTAITTLKPTTTTTLKPSVTSTTLETSTTITTSKPTVTSSTLTPTITLTTSKETVISTASNSTLQTTSEKQDVSATTLNPPTITKFFVCRDANSNAPSGTIQPDQDSTNSNCSFDIVAPSDQQIQIYCSSLNFTTATSNSLIINGDLDNSWQIVPNRVYYSASNNLSLIYSKYSNGDSFDCKWTTAPKEITTESKLCRHAETTAPGGTIQPLAGDTGSERQCTFNIKALPDQQIKISCSVINFTSYSYSYKYLSIDGTLDDPLPYSPTKPSSNQRVLIYSSWVPPVLNRTYYSSSNNLIISSSFGIEDSFSCNWTTVPKVIATNNELCRHSLTSMASGTIQPLESDGGPPRTCFFPISVLPSQRIQISCSDLNLTTQNGNLNFVGITEVIPYYPGPVLNRVYYSADNNVYVSSRFGQENSFACNWTAIPKENATNLQFCRHGLSAMKNGSIEPFSEIDAGEIRECQFRISATPGYQILISCSDINLTTQFPVSQKYLSIKGIADDNVTQAPISNRTYYSNADNQVIMTGRVTSEDCFRCNWTIVPRVITADNKLCLDTVATTANGTIQPLIIGDAEPPRQCTFVISSSTDEQIQISCSSVSAGSSLSFSGVVDYAFPPVVNRLYTSLKYSNQIRVSSQVSGNSNGDWFDCKWAITPRENIADNKLCLNTEATTANGTLTPIAEDTGSPRQCYFSIRALPNEKIRISCSVVNLTNKASYFRIYGAVEMEFPPVVNRVYTSSPYFSIMISSQLDEGDWIDCKWTTTPRKNTAEAQLCSDAQATSANGIIQSMEGDTGPLRWCSFSISAPSDQQIQISCSVVNLTSASSSLLVSGTFGGQSIQPVVNQVYYSTANNYITVSSYLGSEDWMNCEWITIPKEITTESKLCRHTEATVANGSIQPIAEDNTGPPKRCSFSISATYEQKIQISCSVVNLTDITRNFQISGVIDYVYPAPIANRVYTSLYNQIYIDSELGTGDWISCNWTTTPRGNTTDNKLCQNSQATTPNGTIQSIEGDTGPSRSCSFFINAASEEQIQISCSNVTLNTTASSYLSLSGTVDYATPPVLNRVYFTPTAYSQIYINSQLGDKDWISCNWTTKPRENTTESKFCRDEQATAANGTIQSLIGGMGPPRDCPFTITARYDEQIQITCSAVNLTDATRSFQISGVIDYYSYPTIVNRVYTSASNQISISSQLGVGDWIDCKWTTTPKENTTDYKLCQHIEATTANGTIQPIAGDIGPLRWCSFSISAPSDQQIQISCPIVKIDPNSFFQLYETIEYAYQAPVVNRVYFSSYNHIYIDSRLSNEDWIDCKWTTTPKENITDYKLCQNSWATTKSGTIQSTEGDTGPLRSCSFSINPESGEQITISCSNIALNTTAGSYLSFYGGIDYVSPPVQNRLYVSKKNYETRVSSQLSNTDWISCNWTTLLPRENTSTEFQFCLDEWTTSANGSIQPLVGDVGPPRYCSFTITAPYAQQIQISCSAVNFTYPTSYLIISGSLDSWANPPTLNRVYTSSDSTISLSSFLGGGDWINCNWTTIPNENTNTDKKICLHAETTAAIGTIQPLSGDMEPMRQCDFKIKALPGQQIQISCSVANFSSSSSLSISGVIDSPESQLTANRVYYSTSSNFVTLTARIMNTDWFTCNWTTVSRENTTDNQLCHQSHATTANGTLQPISGDRGLSQRKCPFFLRAPNDKQIQFSCSVVNFTISSSYLTMTEVVDSEFGPISPALNRVYYSTVKYNEITITSLLGNEDWMNCNWTTTPLENTTNYKFCHHYDTSSAYGTLQPVGGDPGPSRTCIFYIDIYYSSIQISCSVVNFTSTESYLKIYSNYGGSNVYMPEVNTVYTFPHGFIQLSSKIGEEDWFECQWEPTP